LGTTLGLVHILTLAFFIITLVLRLFSIFVQDGLVNFFRLLFAFVEIVGVGTND